MSFYDLPEEKRAQLVTEIETAIASDLKTGSNALMQTYCADSDAAIRKIAYQTLAKCHAILPNRTLRVVRGLYMSPVVTIRQTATQAAGEIGRTHAEAVLPLLDAAARDADARVRSAMVSASKRMSEHNPEPGLAFISDHLHDHDPRVREAVVRIALQRGRSHADDVLPLLAKLQDDTDRDVQQAVVEVVGAISYHKGALSKVIDSLKSWHNKSLRERVLHEIIDAHGQVKSASHTPAEAKKLLEKAFGKLHGQPDA